MSGNTFINPLRGDRLDDEFATDEELATAIATRVATETYNNGVNAMNQAINNKADTTTLNTELGKKQDKPTDPLDSFVLNSTNNANLALKQGLAPDGDSYALTNSVNSSLQNKQDLAPDGDSYALTNSVNSSLQNKQDLAPDGDSYALTNSVNASLGNKQDLAPIGDSYALTNSVNASLDEKQGKPPVGDSFVLTTTMNSAMSGKQDVPSDSNDSFVLNSDMNAAMNNKQDVPGNNDSFVLTSALNDYALQSDIPTLAGGYSVSQVNYLLDLKADKSELVFRETGEVDENGNILVYADGTPLRDTNYTLTQSEVGTKLYDMDNAIAGKQAQGDYITRDEAVTGSLVGIAGAIGGGLLTLGSTVFTKTLDTGEEVTKTVGDVFDDIGDFLDTGGSGEDDGTNQLDFNSFIQKEGDWQNNDNIQSYTERKAKNTPTLESDNLQIKSSGVRIDSTTATPLMGYKFHVEGDTKIKNGIKKYLDCYNDKVGLRCDADLIDLGCDIKLVGDTCVDGDLKVTGILRNGLDKPYITQEDHDQDITDITDILTDITDAIPTDENGNNEIPDGETLAYNSQITDLQTQIDTKTDSGNVDDLIDLRLQHQGLMDENLQTNVYDKLEVDNLIPDVSSFETSAEIDARLADYTTLSLFEAHEALMETELADKADTTAIPDVSNFITSADLPDVSNFITSSDLPDTSSFITSSDLPDTSSFITDQVSSLANYDTSSTVDGKILAAGVGSHWNRDATTNELTYNSGNVGISTSDANFKLQIGGNDNHLYLASANDKYGWIFETKDEQGGSVPLRIKKRTDDEDTEVLTIKNGDGNVGIGTANPNQKLSIYTGSTSTPALSFDRYSSGNYRTDIYQNDYGADFRVGYDSHTPASILYLKRLSDGYRKAEIYGNLDVSTGIPMSTISPDHAILSVAKDSQPGYGKYGVFVGVHNNNGYSWIQTGRTGSMNLGGATDDTFPLVFNPNGGNIGVGTPNPACKLDIAGEDVMIRGATPSLNFSENASGLGGGFRIRYDGANQNDGNNFLAIQTGHNFGTTSFHATYDGRCGIGTANPYAKLHVVGGAGVFGTMNPDNGVNEGKASYMLFSSSTIWTNTVGNFGDISIYGSNDILSGRYIGSLSGYITASDSRIKKEIVDVEDGSALETLRLLKPKQYKYKDVVNRGSEPVWGFIAQEVRDTLPYATQTRRECLPNIYETANVSDSNVITLTNFNTSNLESNAMVLKVFDTDDTEHLVNITEVVDDHSVRVEEDLSEWTGSVDESGNVVAGNQLFVYGQRVDDFVFLKKDYLWTIATSALQEVDRQLQAEKARNDALEARLVAIEQQLAT